MLVTATHVWDWSLYLLESALIFAWSWALEELPAGLTGNYMYSSLVQLMNSPLGFLLKKRGMKWGLEPTQNHPNNKQQVSETMINISDCKIRSKAWKQIIFNMIPFKRKGPLVFIPLLICAIILSWDAMLYGLEKTAQSVNIMHSSQQGSLLSGRFILNNKSTKPHYKHSLYHTHTKKPISRNSLTKNEDSLWNKGLYCT